MNELPLKLAPRAEKNQKCCNSTSKSLSLREFRTRWHRKSGNDSLLTRTDAQLLHAAGLVTSDGMIRAALILLGTSEGVRRHLAQSEVVFEYRSSEASIPHQERLEWSIMLTIPF